MDRWPRSRCVVSMAERRRNVLFLGELRVNLSAVAGVYVLQKAEANEVGKHA
jgi:hypothetical protein